MLSRLLCSGVPLPPPPSPSASLGGPADTSTSNLAPTFRPDLRFWRTDRHSHFTGLGRPGSRQSFCAIQQFSVRSAKTLIVASSSQNGSDECSCSCSRDSRKICQTSCRAQEDSEPPLAKKGGPQSAPGTHAGKLGSKILLAVALALGFVVANASAPRRSLAVASPPATAVELEVDSPVFNKEKRSIEFSTSVATVEAEVERIQRDLSETRMRLARQQDELIRNADKRHEQLLEEIASLTAEVEACQQQVAARKSETDAAKASQKPKEIRRALDAKLKLVKSSEQQARTRLAEAREKILALESQTARRAFKELPAEIAAERKQLQEALMKLSSEQHASEVTRQRLVQELVAVKDAQSLASAFQREDRAGLNVVSDAQVKQQVRSRQEQLPEDQEEVLVTWKGLPGLAPGQKAQVLRTAASKVAQGMPAVRTQSVSSSGEISQLPNGPEMEKALGWLKWAQLERQKLKKRLLANPELARQYVAEKQAVVLAARDRVMAETWLDTKAKRWEMSSKAALDALEHRLLAEVCMRQDKLAMWIKLKADTRYFFVDLKPIAAALQDAGGTELLALQMRAMGVPTTVELMWIPFRDWNPSVLIQLPGRVAWWGLKELWNLPQVQQVWPWYRKITQGAAEEIFLRFIFPIMPHPVRVLVGLEYSSSGEVTESFMAIMSWLAEAERRLAVRNAESQWPWWITLPIRSAVGGYPLYYVVLPPLRFLLRQLLPVPIKDNETKYKQKLKWRFIEYWVNNQVDNSKEDDPIRRAFDNLKRVRRPELRFSELVGLEAIEEEVDAIVGFLRNPGRYKKLGARPPRGVLIAGPSGSGKTTLALAIAAEAGVPLVEVGARDFDRGEFVGQGAASVRELFKMARETAPVIIFIEEFDQFAGVRGSTIDASRQEMESMLNQVLVELDGFETQEGVVLLATTKRPWAVDPALRRPGRMDRLLELPLPNAAEREAILLSVADRTMAPELRAAVDWRSVAEQTGLMLPPELKLVPDAIFRAAASVKRHDKDELLGIMNSLQLYHRLVPNFLRRTQPFQNWERSLVAWLGLEVTSDDIRQILKVLDFTRLSRPGLELETPNIPWTRDYKYPHAVWAAGRGLLAALLPSFDAVENIWLTPESWEGIGFTRMRPELEPGFAETGIRARTHSEKRLTLLFGSHCAAVLLLPWGQSNTLATQQLKDAQEMSVSMVVEQGWSPDGSPMIYKTQSAERMVDMGYVHAEELEGRARKLYEQAAERAGEILSRNKASLEALVEHLCTYDAIDEEGLQQLLKETGATPEEGPFELIPYQPPTNGGGRNVPTWRRLAEPIAT